MTANMGAYVLTKAVKKVPSVIDAMSTKENTIDHLKISINRADERCQRAERLRCDEAELNPIRLVLEEARKVYADADEGKDLQWKVGSKTQGMLDVMCKLDTQLRRMFKLDNGLMKTEGFYEDHGCSEEQDKIRLAGEVVSIQESLEAAIAAGNGLPWQAIPTMHLKEQIVPGQIPAHADDVVEWIEQTIEHGELQGDSSPISSSWGCYTSV